MNRKQNVIEICCYIVALILLFLYWQFGKPPENIANTQTTVIETPQDTERVQ